MDISLSVATLIANPLLLIVMVIGSYGWWRLVARDSILDAARNWFWSKFPHEGFTTPPNGVMPPRGTHVYSAGGWYCTKGTLLGELLYCPWCLSWWVAVVFFGLYTVWPTFIVATAILQTARVASATIASKVG